jgi:hypothetical protein
VEKPLHLWLIVVSSTHFPALILVTRFVALVLPDLICCCGFAVSGFACCCPVLYDRVNIAANSDAHTFWARSSRQQQVTSMSHLSYVLEVVTANLGQPSSCNKSTQQFYGRRLYSVFHLGFYGHFRHDFKLDVTGRTRLKNRQRSFSPLLSTLIPVEGIPTEWIALFAIFHSRDIKTQQLRGNLN